MSMNELQKQTNANIQATHSILKVLPVMEFCAVSPALISIISATTILQS